MMENADLKKVRTTLYQQIYFKKRQMVRTQSQVINGKAARLSLALPFKAGDPVVAEEQMPPQSTKTLA